MTKLSEKTAKVAVSIKTKTVNANKAKQAKAAATQLRDQAKQLQEQARKEMINTKRDNLVSRMLDRYAKLSKIDTDNLEVSNLSKVRSTYHEKHVRTLQERIVTAQRKTDFYAEKAAKIQKEYEQYLANPVQIEKKNTTNLDTKRYTSLTRAQNRDAKILTETFKMKVEDILPKEEVVK